MHGREEGIHTRHLALTHPLAVNVASAHSPAGGRAVPCAEAAGTN